jgi:RHS repeat-associated protein
MKSKLIILFVACWLNALLLTAQDVSYSSSYSLSGGNPNLVNTSADNSTTGWTRILAPSATANAWSAAQSLPSNFRFHFYGENVTQYKVSYNGVVTFSTSATSVPADNATLPSANLPDKSIACFWDAFAGGTGTEADDAVYVSTQGTSPNRQLWIKWYSMKLGEVSNNYFACILEEGTGNIYMVDLYGGGTQSATVGIQKNSTSGSTFGSPSIKVRSASTAYTDNNYYTYSPSFSTVSNSYYNGSYYMKKGNPLGIYTATDAYTTGWTQVLGPSKTSNQWSATQSLPFGFEFFGQTVSAYKVSLNGVLTFNTSTTALPGENTSLPSSSLPDSSIACFWDAFPSSKTNTDDQVLIYTAGSSPNRQLWIKWHSMKYGNPSKENNYFACVLEESSNRIYIVDMYNQSSATTHTATVGLQLNSSLALDLGTSLRLKSSSSNNWDNNYFVISPSYDEPILSYTAPSSYASGNPGGINTETDTYTSGWTAITSGSISKNAWSSAQSLPFDFLFFGESATQLKASSNGLITFETSTALLPSENENLSSFVLPDKTIACFWEAFPGVTLSANDIVYTKTFGSSPNRQFWIKWNSMRTGNPYSSDNTFACVLEETTNKIYLVDMQNYASSLTQSMTLGLQCNGSYAVQYGNRYNRLLSAGSTYANNYYYEFIPESGDTQLVLTHTELSSLPTKGLFSPFEEDCAEKTVNKAYLYVQLSTGEIYNYGSNAFNATVGFTITTYLTSGAGSESDTIVLNIDQDNPLQLYRKEMTVDFEDLIYVKIKVKEYSSSSLVSDDIELKAYYVTDMGIDASSAGITHEAVSSPSSDNPISLRWSSDCDDVPQYQLQILRLFNTSDSYKSNEEAVSTTVNWDKALNIYTESADTVLSIRLTEGKGYYAWRARAIGTYYEGGLANSNNWGDWSASYNEGATATITSIGAIPGDYVFYYNQFETDKNWIYNRRFAEGPKIAESITYGNALQQVIQTQSYQQSDSITLVGQTLYDFTARPVASTMIAPFNENSLVFRDTLVLNEDNELYSADDFDFDTTGTDDDTFDDPRPLKGGLISRYYSDENSDPAVPDAQDYPYTRTLYNQDGREKEKAGAGEVFRINGSGEGYTRTVKTYYAGTSDAELIKIFGDEAPADSAVYKAIIFDPDKTGSCIYKTLDGKTIATCLVDIWDDHPSRKDIETDAETISDTIKGDININTYTLKKEKVVVLSDPIILDISYTLTPEQIEEECGSFCTSCDYKVILYVKNNEDGSLERIIGDFDGDGYTENKDADTIFIPATSCRTTLSPSERTFTTDILDPGTYTVGRILMVDNVNPDTDVKFFNEHIAEIKDNFETDTTRDFSRLFTLLADTNISGFYNYLESQTGITIDESTEEIAYSSNCCNVNIPIRLYNCDEHPYDDLSEDANGNKDFEKVLFDAWSDEYGSNLYDYFYDTDGTSLYPADATFSADITFSDGNCSSSCDAFLMIGIVRDGDYEGVEWLHSGSTIAICSCPTTSFYGSFFTNYAQTAINSYLSSTYGSSSDYPYTVSVSGDVLTLTANLDNGASYDDLIWVVPSGFSASGYTYSGYGYQYELKQTVTGTYPLANGAFNSMIHKMVNKDGYDGDSLYYCWSGIVSSWESLTFVDGDPDKGSSGNNLRNIFLDCAGWQLGGITNHPWGATNGDGSYDASSGDYGYGFHEFAYKSFKYDTSSAPTSTVEINCFANLDWDWTATADDRFESQEDQEWYQFYKCLEGDGFSDMASEGGFSISADMAGQETMIEAMEDSCSKYCELRAESFYLAYVRKIKASGGTVTTADSVCVVDALIAHCQGFCDLDTTHVQADTNGDGIPDAVSGVEVDTNSVKNMIMALTSSFDLKINSSICPSGYDYVPTAYSYIREKAEIELNEKLQEFYSAMGTSVATLTVPGLRNILNDVYSENGWAASFTCTTNLENGTLFDISNSSYFELRGGSNTVLFLVCDNYPSGCRIIDFAGSGASCDGPIYCVPICFKWTQPTSEPTVNFSYVPCAQLQVNYLRTAIDQQLANCKESHLQSLKDNYVSTCATPSNINDELVVSYTLGYHTYTLFYYDVAGNLVQTVPPLGVDESGVSRNTEMTHSYLTQFKYNSLGQRIYKYSVDGGITQYWHDALGRLRFSQNAKQLADEKYSYVKYDDLGRMIENGESSRNAADGTFVDHVDESGYPNIGKSNVTYSVYSDTTNDAYYVSSDGDTTYQEYTQNRISYVYTDPSNASADEVYTYYSYDPHGNVEWMVQNIPGLGTVQIAYEYDLLTSKVTKVKYQEGRADQFYHAYYYDANNRVTEAKTSRDGVIYDTDTRYEYYAYGPLKRLTIGQDYVQALDYLYTLQGWLKAVNHPSLDNSKDPGGDGLSGSLYAADAWAMSLTYYQGDFDRAGSNFNTSDTYHLQPAYSSYTGNISSMAYNTQNVAGSSMQYSGARGNVYEYDEMNRLANSVLLSFNGTSYDSVPDYAMNLAYDANGNITSLQRYGYSGAFMDDFSYDYNEGNNQLNHIDDPQGSVYGTDMADQSDDNYQYNAIGQLKADAAENISTILWNAGNKIKRVNKSDGSNIVFAYDGLGNRVSKQNTDASGNVTTTYYVRDAKGAELAIYTEENSNLTFAEAPIYADGRAGLVEANVDMDSVITNDSIFTRSLGNKYYELKDHLGNVTVVVSDHKQADLTNNTYTAEVAANTDYYPFGMRMPNMNANSDEYRYGFQGMEFDNELKTNGNSYDFGARIYDPRVGRWLSRDPLAEKYPFQAPYNFCANNPVMYGDPNGMEHVTLAELKAMEKQHTTVTTKKVIELQGSFFVSVVEKEVREVQYSATVVFNGQTYTRVGSQTWGEVMEDNGYTVVDYKGEKTVFAPMGPIIAEEDFVGWGGEGDNCFDNAVEQAEVVPGVKVGNKVQSIQVYTTKGGVQPDAEYGVETIVENLESGIPTVVGIDYNPSRSSNTDKTTDHYITLVGIDPGRQSGKLCFTAYENAEGGQMKGANTYSNYFCVQPDGSIRGQTSWTYGMLNGTNVPISQVRPNVDDKSK